MCTDMLFFILLYFLMEQIKEFGRKINEPISFSAQMHFVSRSQSPVPLTHTNLHTPSRLSDQDVLISVQPTSVSYTTNRAPVTTGSHGQCYENYADSILQSYHKAQITPTAIGNVLQPLVQDKTKPPAKTVPSSSVNKSHRSFPHRACLVHLKEQYHLDHDLLLQPRATKYLVKVRTEISPGRYMAKLELHCSR